MGKRLLNVVLLLFAFTTLFCGGTSRPSAGHPAAPPACADADHPVAALIARYQDAWNGRDAGTLASLYTEDACDIGVWQQELRGRSQIEASFTSVFAEIDKDARVDFCVKAVTPVGDDVAVVSGLFTFQDRRGVVDLAGQYLAVGVRHDTHFLIAELRFALTWKRPRAAQPPRDRRESEAGDTPPDLPAEVRGALEAMRSLWEGAAGTIDTTAGFTPVAHLVDVDGAVYTGGTEITRELQNRSGARRVVPTMGALRGDLAIVDGLLYADGNGLLGLPTARFTAVYVKVDDRWRFLAQMNRATFPDLMNCDSWGPTIDSFERLDEQTSPRKGGIVFVGDSDVVRCDVDRWFPDSDTINRGFGGSQIEHVVYYLQQVLIKHEPRIVVFSCGGNDIAAGKTPERVYGDFEQFVDRVLERLSGCRIVVTSQHTPPIFSEWEDFEQRICKLNDLVRSKAEKDARITFLPETRQVLCDDSGKPNAAFYGRDRLHFSEEGYRRWTAVIAPHLQERIAK